MRILITNAQLNDYAGTQVVVRDLSIQFLRRGHIPMVYSPHLGRVAAEIREQGIEVTDRLAALTVAPEIIHAHHHPQALEALLRFPSVPAVFVCHGSTPYLEAPFYFPRFFRYVAVDALCRERILSVPDIPAERVQIIPNAVELARFPRRSQLPLRPKRALVFSNRASRDSHLPAVRTACQRSGLRLDVLGRASANQTSDPGSVLPHFDIVFAKARSALEALIAGNAVVLCDFAGVGAMVTSENFDALRSMNFGIGTLTRPLQAKIIEDEIARYDASDAQAVTEKARAAADICDVSGQWMQLYEQVISESHQCRINNEEEYGALAEYLNRWSYGKRMQWERQQLARIGRIPLAGAIVERLSKRIARRWFARGY